MVCGVGEMALPVKCLWAAMGTWVWSLVELCAVCTQATPALGRPKYEVPWGSLASQLSQISESHSSERPKQKQTKPRWTVCWGRTPSKFTLASVYIHGHLLPVLWKYTYSQIDHRLRCKNWNYKTFGHRAGEFLMILGLAMISSLGLQMYAI